MALRVLVVDDALEARESMRLLLELHGYQVDTAADGREAVSSAVNCRPDVILMDIAMPIMDGLSATRELRATPETRHMPVVALSAYLTQSRWIADAVDAGCTDFLAKPADWHQLQRVLSRFEVA